MNRDCDSAYTVLESAKYCMSRLIGGHSYWRCPYTAWKARRAAHG
jgi:hypothetical protein